MKRLFFFPSDARSGIIVNERESIGVKIRLFLRRTRINLESCDRFRRRSSILRITAERKRKEDSTGRKVSKWVYTVRRCLSFKSTFFAGSFLTNFSLSFVHRKLAARCKSDRSVILSSKSDGRLVSTWITVLKTKQSVFEVNAVRCAFLSVRRLNDKRILRETLILRKFVKK